VECEGSAFACALNIRDLREKREKQILRFAQDDPCFWGEYELGRKLMGEERYWVGETDFR
jgi:hypothetical protein